VTPHLSARTVGMLAVLSVLPAVQGQATHVVARTVRVVRRARRREDRPSVRPSAPSTDPRPPAVACGADLPPVICTGGALFLDTVRSLAERP